MHFVRVGRGPGSGCPPQPSFSCWWAGSVCAAPARCCPPGHCAPHPTQQQFEASWRPLPCTAWLLAAHARILRAPGASRGGGRAWAGAASYSWALLPACTSPRALDYGVMYARRGQVSARLSTGRVGPRLASLRSPMGVRGRSSCVSLTSAHAGVWSRPFCPGVLPRKGAGRHEATGLHVRITVLVTSALAPRPAAVADNCGPR